MKRILIAMEQFTVGGLETHVRGEIRELAGLGYEVHLAVGEIFQDALLPETVASVTQVSFDVGATVVSFVETVEQIRSVIVEQAIDVVHVHPFASIVPVAIAAVLENRPLIVTLHGPASLTSYGVLEKFLLLSVVLPAASLVVAVSPEVGRLVAPYLSEGRLAEIPNGVEVPPAAGVGPSPEEAPWLLVSRLDEQKIVGVSDFLRKAGRCGAGAIQIVGDGPARAALERFVADEALSEVVSFLGERTDTDRLMRAAAGVAGMGRVVLEAVAARRPAVLVGYDGVKGVVDLPLLEAASQANFSGRGMPTVDEVALDRQADRSVLESLSKIVEEKYSEDVVWRDFSDAIDGAPSMQAPFLAAFYDNLRQEAERIGEETFRLSPAVVSILERVGVAEALFSNRLSMALAVVVRELDNDRRAQHEHALRERVARLEADLAEVRQQLEKKLDGILEQSLKATDSLQETIRSQRQEIAQLQWENGLMKNSLSWRLTRPVRAAGYLLRSPRTVAYPAAKSLYWSLPSGLRTRLNGPRHRIVQWFRTGARSATIGSGAGSSSDLSWASFQSQVLSQRSGYRGVFVQISTIPWNTPLFQRPQHMALALARLGYLVIFRTPVPGGDDVSGFREVSANVWITDSPEVGSIEGAIHSVYSTDSVVTIDDLKRLEGGTLIYEYIDHIDPQISGDGGNIERLERLKSFAFSGGADLIVASAQALYDEACSVVGEADVVLVPNGVDTSHYRQKLDGSGLVDEKAREFRQRYSVVVGYFGALAPWLWYEAIEALVQLRPAVGFVFIGPDYYGGAERLPKTDNVLYLGPVDYQRLPAYGAIFDVCFIPFAPGDVAKTTSPLKLFEYFAMEKPVVSTSFMSECVAFPEVFHGDSARTLALAIDAAAAVAGDSDFRQRLRHLADENSWTQRAEVLSRALDRRRSGED